MPLQKTKCLKCGHERILRTEQPKKCPKCGHKPNTRINKHRQIEGKP